MAKPAGLRQRGGSWEIRVRIPDRLRPIIGKREELRSFGAVSREEAYRLARIERVAIDQRFREAEAQTGMAPVALLTEGELLHLARAFLHKMESEARPLPLIPEDREAELAAVDEEAGLVGQGIYDATVQHVAKSFSVWAGRRVEETSTDFLRICEAVQQAWLEHLGRRSELLAGRPVVTIDPIFAGVDGAQPASAPLTVAAAIQLYKDDPERSGVASKTRAAWNFRFRAIEELLGRERLVGSIKRDDLRACRDALLAMPANATKHFPGMTIAAATVAGEKAGLPKLSPKSVTLYVELISTLFKWMEREEMVSRNPARGLKGPPPSKEKPRRPLTVTEIKALLTATAGAQGTRRAWTYWMVRIAMLNGMRLGEIVGLAVGDVERVDDVWVFRVRPNAFRELKTEASRRDIPIHPWLIEAGLTDLIKGRDPASMLLADAPAVGGTSNAAQKRLGRLVRANVSDTRASFHSLRHNFRDALRDAQVPNDIAARLGGWAGEGSESMEGYGQGYGLKALARWVGSIHYLGAEF